MPSTLTESTATIGASEYSLPNDSTTLTAQTDKVRLTVRVDFGAMAAGDTYIVKLYEKINGGPSTLVESWYRVGVQAEALNIGPILVGGGWDVTVTKSAGTNRSIRWTLEKEVTGVTLTDAASSIGSAEFSLPNGSTTLTAQTTEMVLQPFISFANLAAGDRYRVRVYEQMDGGTSRPIYDRCVDGAQSRLWTCPALLVGGGWDVTVTKVAGTDRVIAWSMRVVNVAAYPSLSTATTVESIRDRIIDVIAALTPTALSGDLFRPYRNEGAAEFMLAMESAPTGALRRVQVIDDGSDEPPEMSSGVEEERLVTFQVLVAYPQTGRYGAEQGLDRHDVMKQDQRQIEQAIGLHGRANFVNPYPDAGWRPGGGVERVSGAGVDFLVITQRMAFMSQLL
jgi:hypothetical protein